MALTHSARLDRLEQTCMRFILKSEMLEREADEYKRTIERLKMRIEKLEAGSISIPIIRLGDLVERAR